MTTAVIDIALAGNPNSGKTTLFNKLTGSRQHVGNYPGVTVEKKEGLCRYKNTEISLTDLPGTYSLTAYTEEEVVARDYLINTRPRVINITDASNLERNLYLTLQLLEMSQPRGLNLPIDTFFRSLAQDQGSNAICIVLSGTGSDGSVGIRAIKGEGGLVIVQSPESAEFDGMPRNAIPSNTRCNRS